MIDNETTHDKGRRFLGVFWCLAIDFRHFYYLTAEVETNISCTTLFRINFCHVRNYNISHLTIMAVLQFLVL